MNKEDLIVIILAFIAGYICVTGIYAINILARIATALAATDGKGGA